MTSCATGVSQGFPVSVHLTLVTKKVEAGQPIAGTVVLTNTTSKRVLVNACAEDGWLQVGLKGKGYSYAPNSLLINCAPTIELRPGKNRFPITVLTVYESCLQPGGSSVTPMPRCVLIGGTGRTEQPPLPPGKYETSVFISGLSNLTQTPNRIAVSLTRPAK